MNLMEQPVQLALFAALNREFFTAGYIFCNLLYGIFQDFMLFPCRQKEI